jgi:hypothetical protein
MAMTQQLAPAGAHFSAGVHLDLPLPSKADGIAARPALPGTGPTHTVREGGMGEFAAWEALQQNKAMEEYRQIVQRAAVYDKRPDDNKRLKEIVSVLGIGMNDADVDAQAIRDYNAARAAWPDNEADKKLAEETTAAVERATIMRDGASGGCAGESGCCPTRPVQ